MSLRNLVFMKIYHEFSFHLQNFDNMFSGKNKITTSARPSISVENGHTNPSVNKTPNLINLNEPKRPSQQHADSLLTQQQYGKTLNVPDTKVLHVLPIATPAAPLNPPRSAIMSTPKSSTNTVKNPSTTMSLLPTETRPLLLVTTANDKQQTVTVPNGRRLPINGRMATVVSSKQRQPPPPPPIPMIGNNHQMVDETKGKKQVRTALLLSSTRMHMNNKQTYSFILFRRSRSIT
jgi:hypothetical protein